MTIEAKKYIKILRHMLSSDIYSDQHHRIKEVLERVDHDGIIEAADRNLVDSWYQRELAS